MMGIERISEFWPAWQPLELLGKVSYTTDDGITKTYYAKISDFIV